MHALQTTKAFIFALKSRKTMSDKSKYEQRGVSATKDEVHEAIKHLDKGVFPNAFCKVMPDIVGGDENFVNLMHADTAGTKTSLAYLYWKETGDVSIWKGIAQDALVMNLDDMACVGAVENILISSTIGRNKNLITGEVISVLINAAEEFCSNLKNHGVDISLAGGETADVGDIVRTIDVGYTAFARMKKNEVIENKIKDGNVIVGLSSSGMSTYESAYNSGISSNGLTAARHDVLSKYYAENFKEAFDPAIPENLVFSGSKRLTDSVRINNGTYSIGQLLLSPTRTFIPVIKKVLSTHRNVIDGMIHCTGGGQGKVMKFVDKKHVIKNNLFPLPPVFEMIKEESGTDLKEMYQVFNMGHRLEFYLPEEYAQEIIDISNSFDIEAKIVGKVEDSDKNKLTLSGDFGELSYL